MSSQTRKVILFIFKIISNKNTYLFWMLIRFISAILPLITIYLFSLVVKHLENHEPFSVVLLVVTVLFVVRILDNFLRLKSITKLEHCINDIVFDIHNLFLSDLKTKDKNERHAIVQAIRNFADATSVTLNNLKQPGIDSLVSFLFIPIILLFIDARVFVLTLANILIYYAIDHYTTQHYSRLKDNLNTKTENYYAKVQDSNDFDLEQLAFNRHFDRLTKWGFTEWFALQNNAVFFYSLILLYLVYTVVTGQKEISDLVLIIGYVTETQILLNSFSSIKDSLADMFVGLRHLAKNDQISAIDLDDLI